MLIICEQPPIGERGPLPTKELVAQIILEGVLPASLDGLDSTALLGFASPHPSLWNHLQISHLDPRPWPRLRSGRRAVPVAASLDPVFAVAPAVS